MRANQEGIAFIKSYESCVLHAYPDPGSKTGLPITIGWGTTAIDGAPIRLDMTCTQEQADAWFEHDLEYFEGWVDKLITVPLTQGQRNALVSFAYNCGEGNLQTSTLRRMLNAGDYAGAAAQFPRWNRGADGVMPGLITRRAAERAMFERSY